MADEQVLWLSQILRQAVLGSRFLVAVGFWILHLLLADLALTALLPAATAAPTPVYHLSSRIAESVWRGVQ